MESVPKKLIKNTNKILCIVISLTLVLIALSSSANADRGMVSLQGISVYEPGQKAIIAWNGSEEILILSTDVHSESNTSVLEILPLPSMPNVTLGNFSSFYKIQELIWYHSYYKSVEDRNYYLAAQRLEMRVWKLCSSKRSAFTILQSFI
ncbi:MAG: hypothetical protein QME47_05015 [Candidatus Thermoplasmatota archaeon]|nr:hypothetical protein [Candidatus Thermoplasmatota archaeon]